VAREFTEQLGSGEALQSILSPSKSLLVLFYELGSFCGRSLSILLPSSIGLSQSGRTSCALMLPGGEVNYHSLSRSLPPLAHSATELAIWYMGAPN